MKKLTRGLFSLLCCFLSSLTLQAQVFCEDYNNPTTNGWFQIGSTSPFPNPNCGLNSTSPLGTINFTGQLEFNQFRMRQTTTQAVNVAPHLPNQNVFRIEFDYIFQNTTTSSPLMLMALTEHPISTRFYSAPSTWGGGSTENNTNSIEVRIGNTLNTTNNFFFAADSKFGFIRNTSQASISVPNGTQYNTKFYLRLERINASTAVLSVFLDAARTVLLGSDCFALDPGITDLSYIQHGGRAGAGCSNITTSQLDNLCIFTTIASNLCNTCNPMVSNSSTTFNCTNNLGSIFTGVTGGTAPYTYSWSNGATTANLNNVAAGTYSVNITDVTGCRIKKVITLGPPTLSATFSVTPSCLKECLGTLTISNPTGGVGPYQYSVNSSPFSSTAYYPNLCGGPNTATIMDANGCQTSVVGNIPTTSEPWPKQPVSTGIEYASGNGIDVYEAKYLTGQFYSRIAFANALITTTAPPITLVSNTGSDEDAYLVKYDDCGVQWAFGFGSSQDSDEGVTVRYSKESADDSSRLILAANIHGPLPNGIIDATGASTTMTTNGIDLTSDPVMGVSKGLIMSVDESNGAIDWVYLIGDNNMNNSTEVNDIKLDHTTIYAIGNATGSTLGLGTDANTLFGGTDIFLMHLDMVTGTYTTGNSTTWGTPQDDNGEAIGLRPGDFNRYVYATGYLSYDFINIQGNIYNTSPSSNGKDLFVAAFGLGNLALANFAIHRSPDDDEGLDIISSGDVTSSPAFVVTGSYENTLDLYSSFLATVTHPGMGPGNKDAFVAAFDGSFNHVWSDYTAGANEDVGEAICYEVNANTVYVAGEFSDAQTGFLSGQGVSGGAFDIEIFVTGFDFTSGTVNIITTQIGTGIEDRAFDIETSGNELYTSGQFGYGSLDFPTAGNPILYSGSGIHDAYFARLDFGGNFFRTKNPSAAIENAKNESTLTLFPNPSKGEFNLRFEEAESGTIKIYDIHSRLIREEFLVKTGSILLNLSNEANGVYFIELNTPKGMQTKKIIVQH